MASRKLYSFDDHPEHKAELGPWAQRWIANALNCEAMTDADRDAMRVAIDGLYRAVNLEPPPAHRVIFVRSPIVGAVAASIAAAAWWIREHPTETRELFGRVPSEPELMAAVARAAGISIDRCVRVLNGERLKPLTRDATDGATDDATDGATDDATDDATADATRGATRGATAGATRGATAGATRGATAGATYGATDGATAGATYGATDGATDGATADATRGATAGATYGATDGATYGATDGATDGATAGATYGATDGATDGTVTLFLVRCIAHWWKFRDGGNMWSGWPAYLSFFRHVAKLEIDYSKWQHYEAAAIHAGPRFMHERFCIISDRPEFVHRDNAHRAHCIDGPHMKWRDGIELHHIHGIRVMPRITANQFTAREVLEQPNAEVRRVMLERYNQGDAGRWLRDLDAKPIHSDTDPLGLPRRLFRVEQEDDEPFVAIEVTNSTPEPDGTRKVYTFRCHPELRPLAIPGLRAELGPAQKMTCANAIASTYGMTGDEYHLSIQT